MDWSNALTIIIGVLVIIGLPLALRKRKKVGPPEERRALPAPSKNGSKDIPGANRR